VNKDPKAAKQFVDDIKAGVPDLALQRKYGLHSEKFFIFKAAALDFIAAQAKDHGAKRQISARQILADIRKGMDNDDLMAKYCLSARQLQSVLRKMIHAGLITALELSRRLSITRSQVMEAFQETGKAIRELD
jgi:hypothetical protein